MKETSLPQRVTAVAVVLGYNFHDSHFHYDMVPAVSRSSRKPVRAFFQAREFDFENGKAGNSDCSLVVLVVICALARWLAVSSAARWDGIWLTGFDCDGSDGGGSILSSARR